VRRVTEHADRGQRQLLSTERHLRSKLEPAGHPADVQPDRGRLLGMDRTQQGFRGDHGQAGRRGLFQQSPETGADSAEGEPGAARQGVSGPGTRG
jgi:hypothetical protein